MEKRIFIQDMFTRREILDKLDKEELIVTPMLDRELQLNDCGIDLRLGVAFIASRNSSFTSLLDPVEHSRKKIPIELYQERVFRPIGQPFLLHPGEVVLGVTLEYLILSPYIAGMITGRSSWGKMGIMISTGMLVNPGFRGCLTLELTNQGRIPVHLYPGMRICQIMFYGMETDISHLKESRYSRAIGPKFSKLEDDPEISYLGRPLSPLIIGVTGLINAGKSRIASFIADRLGLVAKSTSLVLAQMHEGPFLSSDDKYQFKINLRAKEHNDVLVKHIADDVMRGEMRGIVIDGLDHPDEIRYLSKRFKNFYLLAVTGNDTWRYNEYTLFNTVGKEPTLDEFKSKDERERNGLGLDGIPNPNADNLNDCLNMARFYVYSEKNLQETFAQVEKFLEFYNLSSVE